MPRASARRPFRIQCLHTDGGKIPDGAIYVGPGSAWANPFAGNRAAVRAMLAAKSSNRIRHPNSVANRRWAATEIYRAWVNSVAYTLPLEVLSKLGPKLPIPPSVEDIQVALRGRVLADWCDLEHPSHADVLAAIANSTGSVLHAAIPLPIPDVRGAAVTASMERRLKSFRSGPRWGR